MATELVVVCALLGAVPDTLTLDAAVEIAERQARAMIRARADVLLAEVSQARALAAVLPRVDLTLLGRGDVNRNRILEQRTYPPEPCPADGLCGDPRPTADPDYTDLSVDQTYVNPVVQARLGVRQLLFDGGRWWVAIARAENIERQQRALLDAVRNNTRLSVVRAFYGYERARQAVLTFQAQIDKGEAQVERVRDRYAKGLASSADVANAERNLAQDRLGQAQRLFAESRARRALNLAMGRPAKTPVEIEVSRQVASATVGAVVQIPDLEPLEAMARHFRPELRYQRARLDVLQKDVTLRRADYWPRVTMGANYIRSSRLPERTFDPNLGDNFDLRLDVTLQWNLFRGLGTNADVDAALLNLEKARADAADTERAVFNEVQDNRQNLALQGQVFALARTALESAAKAVAIARGDFSEGRVTAFELRDAEQNYTRARQAAIDARLAVEVARESLRRAVGGPFGHLPGRPLSE